VAWDASRNVVELDTDLRRLMTALILMTVLGLIGLALQHKISWVTGGVLVIVFAPAVMLGNFACATWHRRSRLAGEDVMFR
jgi:hypothetical protein